MERRRKLDLSRFTPAQSRRRATGTRLPVWVRDQFSSSETDLVNTARAAGVDNPTLYVFIPRKAKDELLNAIAAAQAAEQTISAKGAPSTPEGQLARQSMESRRVLAAQQRDSLVREIVSAAKVYQGGASELLHLTLDEKLKAGAEESLKRLFPRFKDADFAASAWEAAIKRARDGADNPFSPLKYEGAIEQHPVCQQVLATIGSGKTGTQVRKESGSEPVRLASRRRGCRADRASSEPAPHCDVERRARCRGSIGSEQDSEDRIPH